MFAFALITDCDFVSLEQKEDENSKGNTAYNNSCSEWVGHFAGEYKLKQHPNTC
jgi:hypothetical protein